MIHRFFCNLARGDAPMWFLALATFAVMVVIVFTIDKIMDLAV